jgi:hypothetical protein
MLAEIKDEHDQMVVDMYLTINDPDGWRFYWIGLTDIFQVNTWMWEPSSQPATYFKWAKGEPNGAPDERFVHLVEKARERKWNDLQESGEPYQVYALCQKNI